jgi:hypothetical protein
MKKRLSLALAIAVVVGAFVGVSSASAATEFGSSCTGNDGGSELVLISTKHSGSNPLPVTAPISGVITEWKTNLQLGPVEPEAEAILNRLYAQTLDIFHSAGGSSYTLISENPGTAKLNFNGVTTNLSRIPVQAGDYLGLDGLFFTLYCETGDPGDEVAFLDEEAVTVGSTHSFEMAPGAQVPVVARVEPDVDGDGYGDETQDKCPQSAAYQTPCPVVTISSLPILGKKAVTVHVATSLSAPVGVTATVSLGKGKTATLSAATQTVGAGVLTPFTLTLSSQVTKALKALPTSKSLTMSIVASATNVTGSPSTSATTVKLKGQAKPVHHKKKKAKATKK